MMLRFLRQSRYASRLALKLPFLPPVSSGVEAWSRSMNRVSPITRLAAPKTTKTVRQSIYR